MKHLLIGLFFFAYARYGDMRIFYPSSPLTATTICSLSAVCVLNLYKSAAASKSNRVVEMAKLFVEYHHTRFAPSYIRDVLVLRALAIYTYDESYQMSQAFSAI